MARLSLEEISKQNVNKLIDYALNNLYLHDYDVIFARNILLDMLNLDAPSDAPINGKYDIYEVLQSLCTTSVKRKIIKESDVALFETKLIGVVTPPPSAVVEKFDDITAYEGIEKACQMLYKLGEDSLYLRRKDIDKNIIWKHKGSMGDIVVTINLSKPEKTPEQVRLAKEAKTGYPKCILCGDNLGFWGNAALPARQTIRTIPFELDGENWFMQYSPYNYFEQHLIAISQEHRPMHIDEHSFARMADFINLFPHYFIGSNAALPIVGGSVLAHDHYQGGKKVLPVFYRGSRKSFTPNNHQDVRVSIVDWYNSIVRIEGKNRDSVLDVVNKVHNAWFDYSDEGSNVISCTMQNGEKVQHNAITPICSFNENGEYQFNLILRNNRTDEQHPFGIFHPAQELHNIKQESIGIIEVMGVFILPGRLSTEIAGIKDILTGKTPLDFKSISEDTHPLHKHLGMITQLVVDNGTTCTEDKAKSAITDYINTACERILDTTAVFKNNESGQVSFERFINLAIN